MAQFFALLLALIQAPAAPPPASFDARWVTAFENTPAARPGFDVDTAYVPLNGGQLVAVDLDRGTIRWTLDVPTTFTPATGGGLVYTVSDQTIEARDAATGETRWHTALPGGAAAPL
jgi:outer membrane protein assembly factor BamB